MRSAKSTGPSPAGCGPVFGKDFIIQISRSAILRTVFICSLTLLLVCAKSLTLYRSGLGEKLSDAERWKRIYGIPDSLLWRVKTGLKFNLVNYLIQSINQQWIKYDTKTMREEIIAKINPAALMIGFARRFAPYKRAYLLLSDLDRLDRIMNNERHPVHLIFAGKAHPSDKMGMDLIKSNRNLQGQEVYRKDFLP